jgi:hypothetical protein
MELREIGWGVWSGFTWLRLGSVGGLLWLRWWTFGFWRHGVSFYATPWHPHSSLSRYKKSLYQHELQIYCSKSVEKLKQKRERENVD